MNQIKSYREKKGLTQQVLAQILELDTSTVAKWETQASAPRARVLLKLADVLECSVDELLKGGSGDDRP